MKSRTPLGTRFVNWVLRQLTHVLCRIDASQLHRIPAKGPLIIVVNHVNFLDAPVFYLHILPRPLTALVKTETWDSPFLGPLFSLWKAIPIRRGEADLSAFHAAQQTLMDGKIMVISPEGTRSGDGRLLKGLPGVVLLAARTGAPIMPVVYYGHENYRKDYKRLRRPNFKIVVGNPFKLNLNGIALSRDVREQVTEEIMFQLASLLPEEYRGQYSNLYQASEEYLVFDVGMDSNLRKVRGKLEPNLS
jgi:1-acyl-sn-glycerol-3-phosphate acyltransferase